MIFFRQVVVLAACGLAICSAVIPADEVKSNNDSQVVNPVGVTNSQNLSDGIRHLNEIARRGQLRGSSAADQGDEHDFEMLDEVKKVMDTQLDQLKGTIARIEDSTNKAETIGLISSFLGDSEAVDGLIADVPRLGDSEEAPAMDGNPPSRDISQLSKLDQDELKDTFLVGGKNTISHMQKIVDDFDSIISKQHRRRASSTSGGHDEGRGGRAQYHSSGGRGALPKFPSTVNRAKLPSLNAAHQLLSKRGNLDAHRHLQQENPLEQCQACDADDFSCNCNELFSCAGKLSWYDFAVLFLGGYVDNDPDSVSHGQLTVDSFEDVNIFDARTELGNKIQKVKGYLAADDARDIDTCKSMLSEFTTACFGDQCDNPNIQATQLAVSEVCDAVDTRVRLSIEVMGRFYDFRNVAHKTELIANSQFSQHFAEEVEDSHEVIHAVRCCADEVPGQDNQWPVAPLAQDSTCRALEQRWTGDLPLQSDGVPNTPYGFTGYKDRKPNGNNKVIREVEGIETLAQCAQKCMDDSDCASFFHGKVGKYVFGTSAEYRANLGGLDGADGKCQTRAEAAGLPGTYKAWLSDRDEDVRSRFDRTTDDVGFRLTGPSVDGFARRSFRHGTTGSGRSQSDIDDIENVESVQDCADKCRDNEDCVSFAYATQHTRCKLSKTIDTLDQTGENGNWDFYFRYESPYPIDKLADDWEDLTRGNQVIDFDEKGDKLPFDLKVRTGTNADGTYAGDDGGDCFEWRWESSPNARSWVGLIGRSDELWTKAQRHYCKYKTRLYCFQQDTEPHICSLSSSADHYSKTDQVTPDDYQTNWFFKTHIEPNGYEKHSNRHGKPDSAQWDIADIQNVKTVQNCANMCSADKECVSFAYGGSGSTSWSRLRCRLSKTIDSVGQTNYDANTNNWDFYLKEQEEDQEDCVFLPYREAEIFCEEKGGRLCTRDELANGCAAFTGCSFDDSNAAAFAWTSTAASPETCTGPTGDSASYASCREFVTAFDALYDAWLSSWNSDIVDIGYEGDYLQIGNWRLARTCEYCSDSHLSISSQTQSMTSQIFRSTGSLHPGPRTDQHGFDLTGNGLTNSAQPIVFGHKAVQIRDWRIRQINSDHLSVTNENGNVSRIYRSDGTVHGNVRSWGGYVTADLGEPACVYLTSSFLQIGDWRFGEITSHLSVTHKDGKTAMIYRHDGTIHPGPRSDYNAWTLVDDEVLAGTKDGCIGSNPMRAKSTVAVGQDFGNVRFPSDVAFDIDTSSGVASFDSYLYDSSLSTDEAVQFCGAVYGPPLELSKACDSSIGVLLGREISIGLLSSTSKALGEFVDGQYSNSPHRWVEWFEQLKDDTLIGSEKERSDFYQSINYDQDEPEWLEFYLSIRDENPYYSPRQDLPVFCVDEEINSDPKERIGSCPRAWIDDASWNAQGENPYQWQDTFDAFVGPDESCLKCDTAWLEMTSNAFEAEELCHSFFYECVESVERLYQCNRFWDECRLQLNAAVDYWEYPRRQCDIEVCDEEWLVENPFDPEDDELACYDFAEHCLSEFKAEYPDVEYPVKYCNGNPDMTCQLSWVDNSEDLGDEECNKFKDYCQRQLVLNHPRYVWPMRNVTVDDIMPGYCCLDTPIDTDESNVYWGERYTSLRSAEGMTCQKRGLFHTGLSEDACSNVGGNWFRTACINLYTCIEARPRVGDAGYKDSFEEWVKSNQVAIYDPHDEEQCEQARSALGYAPDYIDDFDVCQTFNDLLCDPFYEDLEFLSNGNDESDRPTGFQQIVYTPIEYPPDKALFFDKLPKEPKMAEVEILPQDKGDSINYLEEAKLGLFILKTDGFDLVNKFQMEAEDAYKFRKAACDLIEDRRGELEYSTELAMDTCESLELTLGGNSAPAKAACITAGIPAWLSLYASTKVAETTCKAYSHLSLAADWFFKQLLWLAHYGSKVAYSVVSRQLYLQTKKASSAASTYNGEEYTKATYNTLIQHDQWNHDALGVINKNMINQHTQMRKELQNRHQDITNDVNQYTTCIANYLGVEIISRLPGTTVGPLSSLCAQLLGLNGRRLEDGAEAQNDRPFNIEVAWDEGSVVKQQQASMEMERDILEKEDSIMEAQRRIENRLGINCGNSRCEQEEANINCPQDCAEAEFIALSTNESMATGFTKLKFTVHAKRKVAISALSFFTKDALEESNVKIRTMQGIYPQTMFSLDHEWQDVLSTKVPTTEYNGGTVAPVKFEFNHGIQITVDGGKCQSFEVYSDSGIMVHVSGNMTETDMVYEDDALQIFTGRGIDDHSPKPIQFNGVIGYDGLARVPEISTSNSHGGIAADQTSAAELVLEQEMKSAKRKITAIQRKVGQIDVLSTKLSALDDKISAKLSAQDDKMSALDVKMSAIEGMLAQLLEKNER